MEPINALSSPETQMNGNFQTLEWAQVYGRRVPVTTGLTWGYYGGVLWGGIPVVDGTLALTDAAANYIVVEKATGAISVSSAATNWDDTEAYARVYKVTTAAGVVSAVEDHRAGPGGIFAGGGESGGGGGGGGAVTVADTLPVLEQGGLWFESDTGGLYLRYVNPDATETLISMHPIPASLTFAPPPSPLLTGLISYWKLDEASGNALDAHGTNHLTDMNTVGSAAGKIGNARVFVNANTEYFTRVSGASLSMGAIDFTFSCWLKFNEPPSDRTILAKWSGSSGSREFGLFRAPGQFQFYVQYGAAIPVFNSSGTPGNWMHLICWQDTAAQQIGLSVNGTVATAGYSGTPTALPAIPFEIGSHGGANAWDGQIDEVGCWKRLLTPAERTELYNGGAGKTYPFT